MVLHPVVRIRDAQRLRDTNLDLPAAKNQTNGSKSTAKNTVKRARKSYAQRMGVLKNSLITLAAA